MKNLVISNIVTITPDGLELNASSSLSFDGIELRDKKLELAYRNLEVNYPKFFKMDAQSKLGWLCAEYLMKQADSLNLVSKQDIALVLSNQKASLDTDLNYLLSLPSESEEFLPSPAVFVYTLPNIVAGEICIRHGLKGENNFFISEHFDAQQLVHYTEALFYENLCKAALVGWIEVYQERFRAILVAVESVQEENNMLSYNTENFNQLYQKSAL